MPIRFALAALAVVSIVALSLMSSPAEAAACKNAATPAHSVPGKVARKATLCLINEERAKRGIRKLSERKDQRKAAKKHNSKMLSKRCFSHQCSGEGDLVTRLNSSGYLPCSCNWGVGENIAYGFGSKSTPKFTVKAWMRSAGHRQNILNSSFEHIGIAVDSGAPTGGGAAATFTTSFGYRD